MNDLCLVDHKNIRIFSTIRLIQVLIFSRFGWIPILMSRHRLLLTTSRQGTLFPNPPLSPSSESVPSAC